MHQPKVSNFEFVFISFYSVNLESQNKSPYNSNSSREQLKQLLYSNIRVVQTNLVYAIGLRTTICQSNMLQSKKYFGKYGNVSKVIINKQQNANQKNYKNPSFSAYITYDNEVSAALAVMGLFQWKFQDKIMRCCFGTSKYCEIYFKGGICKRQSCVYLHKRNKNRQIQYGQGNNHKQNERQIFQIQYSLALQTVSKNYRQIIKKYKHQEQQNQRNSVADFPNIYSILKILVIQNYITSEQYQAQWQLLSQPQLKTCHSQSTQCSPLKQIEQYEQNHDKIQQEVVVNINNNQQLVIDCTLEQLIHRSLISKLYSKQKFVKSYFHFGNGINEDSNLKKYVQKYIVNAQPF